MKLNIAQLDVKNYVKKISAMIEELCSLDSYYD